MSQPLARTIEMRSTVAPWLLLGAVCFATIFAGLGRVPLVDPDEPYYAVPAREMLEQGTWAVPIFQGKPWFDKPIFFYWVVLCAYKVLGVSALSARLGSAVAAAIGVAAVYLLARRSGLGPRGALGAGLVLATSLEYAGR